MGIESLMLGNQQKSILDFVRDLFNKENIEMKSDISNEEIGIILELEWQNQLVKPENEMKTGIEIFVEHIVPKFLELKVSKEGNSRRQAEKILSSVMPTILEQETSLAKEMK